MYKILRSIILLILVCAIGISCVSYMSYRSSSNEILKQRVLASGNVDAVNALRMGVTPRNAMFKAIPIDGGIGIGVDLVATDVILKHPFRQFGAAILDAALLYGASEGIQSLNGGGSLNGGDGVTIEVNGRDNDVSVVNGNQNTSNNDREISGDDSSNDIL